MKPYKRVRSGGVTRIWNRLLLYFSREKRQKVVYECFNLLLHDDDDNL